MKLIIQIPCYNEAETLEIALNDLPKHIDGIDEIEYLIINDGSKDNTVEVAKNWGVNYVVNFKKNKGLAKGFMAGLDACLRNGADIIVNTDADNQYCGEDIEKIVRPILNGEADIVIGERPIDQTEHFSPLKKKLQHFGSWVVRKASNSDIPDAPSGFRAYSRDAAMRLNVTNEYKFFIKHDYLELDTKNLVRFKDDSDYYGEDITPMVELIGDNSLTKTLYCRQLCGQWHKSKQDAFRDLLESTEDRVIVFYNFNEELSRLTKICDALERPYCAVNGQCRDLRAYC